MGGYQHQPSDMMRGLIFKGIFRSMLNNVTLPILPELSTIDFTCTSEVRELIRERFHNLFSQQDDAYIDLYMDTTDDLFAGRNPEFQAMDTAYHDITHTLQATLCVVELLHNRHFTNDTPRIDAGDFKRTLIAALFHDMGYLKRVGDNEGSGAKFTHVHEQRSCDIARAHLLRQGWSTSDTEFVENLISATGPSTDVTKVEFRSDIERLLGQAVCTADYVGQMSDPNYPDKLPVLFEEFKESYRCQQLPKSEWPFASYEELLKSTPNFWSIFVQKKLAVECDGLSRYLKHPVSGRNPYLESIERNLVTINQRIEKFGE
jgi:hypothetical protein